MNEHGTPSMGQLISYIFYSNIIIFDALFHFGIEYKSSIEYLK